MGLRKPKSSTFLPHPSLLPLLLLIPFVLGQNAGNTGGGSSAIVDNTEVNVHPNYVIIGPRVVRPGADIRVGVTILPESPHAAVRVSASIVRDGVEVSGDKKTFYRNIQDQLLMAMPKNAEPGNYNLTVQGNVDGDKEGFLFIESKQLVYDSRSLALFIQFSQPIQSNGRSITFRIIALQKDLSPYTGNVEVKVIDANGITFKYYKNVRCFQGIAQISFERPTTTSRYDWVVDVLAQGHHYKNKFYMAKYKPNRIEVNVTSPMSVEDTTESFDINVFSRYVWDQRYMDGMLNVTATITSGDGKQVGHIVKMVGRFYKEVTIRYRMEEFQRYVTTLDGSRIQFMAFVTEPVWDDHVSGFSYTDISSKKLYVKFLGNAPYVFKPEMPFSFQVVAYLSDRTAQLPGNRRITAEVDGKKYESPIREDGVARFEIAKAPRAETFSIRAYYDNDQTKSQTIMAVKQHSETNQYLHVTTSTITPTVGRYLILHIYSDHSVLYVNYAVLSASTLVAEGRVKMMNRQATYDIAITNAMFPSAHVVVYHVGKNGRIVADSLSFHANQDKDNRIKVTAHTSKDPNKRMMEIVAEAEPGSYVGFSAVNFYQHSLAGGWGVTEQKLNHELDKFDLYTNKMSKFTFKGKEQSHADKTVFMPSSTRGIDVQSLLTGSGYLMFTDAKVSDLFGENCNASRHAGMCSDKTCYEPWQKCDGKLDCADGSDEGNCPDLQEEALMDPYARAIEKFQQTNPVTSMFYPTDWAFQEKMVDYYGKAIIQAEIPDFETTYAITAFAIHRHKGLQLYEFPAFVDCTPYFALRLQGPYDGVRLGEQIGIMAALVNNLDQDVECLVSLRRSDDYKFILVDDFNYIRAYDPKTEMGKDLETLIVVKAKESRLIHFPVVATRVGKVGVTIDAKSSIATETKTFVLDVEPQGVRIDEYTSVLIDLMDTGKYQDFIMLRLPETYQRPLDPKYLFVPGSRAAEITLVGDIMGNNLIHPVLRTEDTLDLEYYSGDSVLFSIAANVITMRYLKESDYLTTPVLQENMKGVNKMYARLLSHFKPEGSFRPFRGSTKGNLWFTANVYKYLRMGQIPEWEDIFFVDNNMLEKMLYWMLRFQHNTTEKVDLHRRGCFFEPYNVTWDYFHFLSDYERDNNTELALTAHVLIAIAEEPRFTLGEIGSKIQTSITNAMHCLENNMKWILTESGSKDPHFVNLITYALHVVSSQKKEEAWRQMQALKKGKTDTYWSLDTNEIPDVERTTLANFPRQLLMPLSDTNFDSHNIASSAYGLMTYIKRLDPKDVDIVKFLSRRRPFRWGWRSTRGTLLALEALRKFARREFKRTQYDITVALNMSLTPPVRHQFDDLERRALPVCQTIKVPDAWGQLEIHANGTGYALFGILATMYVEHEDQYFARNPPITKHYDLIDTPQDPMPFGLKWDITFSGRNMSNMNWQVKVNWRMMDVAVRSNMAVLKIDLPSGYQAWDEDIVNYAYNSLATGKIPNLVRAKSTKASVFFYFQYLDRDWTTLNFNVKRWFPVANMSQWHEIKVYDYYEPMITTMRMYDTIGLKNLDICKVCGSFQCPYCYDYNAAFIYQPSFVCFASLIFVSFLFLSDFGTRFVLT